MANIAGFNANEVEPNEGFEPLPAGVYSVAISESEMKENKNRTGSYLKLTFVVLDGEYRNRKLWTQLNLANPNETAVKIARGELSAICRAVNVMVPSDSSELHNIPLTIKVGLEKRADTDEMQNRIKAYHPQGWKPGAQAATKATPSSAPVNGSSAPAANRMGWMGK